MEELLQPLVRNQLEFPPFRVVAQFMDIPFGAAVAGLFQLLSHDYVIVECPQGNHAVDRYISILLLFHLFLESLAFLGVISLFDPTKIIAKRVKMLYDRRKLTGAPSQFR